MDHIWEKIWQMQDLFQVLKGKWGSFGLNLQFKSGQQCMSKGFYGHNQSFISYIVIILKREMRN